MSVIRWEDPPASKGMAVHDWPAIGAQLVAAPGKWALVAVCPNGATAGSTARHVRDGKYDSLRDLGVFEAKSRTVGGEYRVYARFVGPGSTSPEPGPTCEAGPGCIPCAAEPTKGGTE